jgi:parallel beta-helix repeat protein
LGTYHESVAVDKAVRLVGENKETTIISGDGNDTTLAVVCDGVTVTGFTVKDGGNVTSGTGGGICLNNANGCVVSDTVVIANNFGIYLQESGNNTLRNNNIFGNRYNFGVSGTTLSDYLNDVDSSNTVNGEAVCYWIDKHNIALPLDIGYLALVNCTDIVVKDLNLTNNANGLVLVHSKNLTITANTFKDNYEGLKLVGSYGNVLSGNHMHNNVYNLWVSDQFENDIDETNTVDGKPVYYWIEKHNQAVPNNAGYVALINCTGITVQNLQLSKNGQGILLVDTRNANISKNSITNHFSGIEMDNASNNIIVDNVIEENTDSCILVTASANNSIYGNSITQNLFGINFQSSILGNSTYNEVIANNISLNDYHIRLEYGSDNNIFYHNNFINNTEQVSTTQIGYGVVAIYSSTTNVWDNGSEGNYWSDYNGTDADGDGIGDIRYVINNSNIDDFPLMFPFKIQ